MERIGFLINKLKEQYEKASSQDSMLVTLQMLYRELMPKMDGNSAIGNVSVVVPGQMDLTALEKSISQKFALDLTPNQNGKQVFELSVDSSEELKSLDKQQVVEIKPIDKPLITAIDPPKNPFIISAPKTEIPVPKPEPIIAEKPKETIAPTQEKEAPSEVNYRFMPQELKPNIEPPVEPAPIVAQPVTQTFTKETPPNIVPPKEVHESIQISTAPSFNDKVEKRQPELFHVLKAEPLKDLKKAISINERFQYINHLFMKDETMYERSLKTINSFNVFSEAQFWIRKELAIKMGWSDDDEVVQQFMHLVERRFL